MQSQYIPVGGPFAIGLTKGMSDTYKHINFLLRIGKKSLADVVLRYAVKN